MPTTAKVRPAAKVPAAARGAINIRVHDDERALIDQAAALQGKSRSEFMLDASRRAAADAILDRSLFRLDPRAFAKFTTRLDEPPQPNAALRKLMKTKAPWE